MLRHIIDIVLLGLQLLYEEGITLKIQSERKNLNQRTFWPMIDYVKRHLKF